MVSRREQGWLNDRIKEHVGDSLLSETELRNKMILFGGDTLLHSINTNHIESTKSSGAAAHTRDQLRAIDTEQIHKTLRARVIQSCSQLLVVERRLSICFQDTNRIKLLPKHQPEHRENTYVQAVIGMD